MPPNDGEDLPSANSAEHAGAVPGTPATSNAQDGDQGEDASHESDPPPPPKKRQKATWGGKGEANMRTLATHMTPGRRVLDFLKGEHPMRDDHLWCNCCGCPIQGRSTYNRRIFGQTNRTPKQQHQRTKAADQRPFGAAEPHGDCRPVLVPGK